MKDRNAQALMLRAEEWLQTARLALEERHFNAAYECARRACELVGKALLLDKLGSYPREHEIQGVLAREGLVPPSVNKVALSRLLSDYTRGTYGFSEPVSRAEAERALRTATRLHARAAEGV